MKTKTRAKPKAAKKRSAKLVKLLKKAVARSGRKAGGKTIRSAGAARKAVAKTKSARSALPARRSAPAKQVAAKAAPSRPRQAGNGALSGTHLTEEQIRRMPDSEYMNEAQLEFFRQRLLKMREEVLARELDVKQRLNHREVFADPADRATAEEEHWLDLRLRERESLLLRKIDEALRRIADREYGYCEVTGDPIGIPRLLARPTATVSVDVKGQNEQIESQFRDR